MDYSNLPIYLLFSTMEQNNDTIGIAIQAIIDSLHQPMSNKEFDRGVSMIKLLTQAQAEAETEGGKTNEH